MRRGRGRVCFSVSQQNALEVECPELGQEEGKRMVACSAGESQQEA
jgi:hypothetical protein